MNGRSFNINGGNQGALAYIDSTLESKCQEVVQDLQNFSQYLAGLPSNNNVTIPTDQPGPLNFYVNSVNNDGLAIFSLACDDALNNQKVQQIEIINNVNAQTIVINLSGQTCSFQQGNMVGTWLTGLDGRSRTVWNVYETPLNSNSPLTISNNLMGTLLAPYYSVETTSNIDGSAAVYNMKQGAELHNPPLNFPPCVAPQSKFISKIIIRLLTTSLIYLATPTATIVSSTTGTTVQTTTSSVPSTTGTVSPMSISTTVLPGTAIPTPTTIGTTSVCTSFTQTF
jgi:choice-of-anchor A domain-containing protein